MTILLLGRVGSHAYGLATPQSDEDWLGVYAVPTERLFVLKPPKETIVGKAPDTTLHEAAKYCRLALQCNPTALELLYLDDYTVKHERGAALVDIRHCFLSRQRVRDAYLGYATQQLRRMNDKWQPGCDDDTVRQSRAKHARHTIRLLIQSMHLDQEGHIKLKLDNAAEVTELAEEAAGGNTKYLNELFAIAESSFNRPESALPPEPQTTAVDYWLTQVRLELLTATL